MEIKYFDRETNLINTEKVAGERYLKWLYENPIGLGLLEMLVKRKFFSYFYGKLQDTSWSTRKIQPFIKDYDIDMSDYKLSAREFKSFNDFFYRELKEGARPIASDPGSLISPADGRLLAFDNINIKELVQVKGSTYSLSQFIGDIELAEAYQGGACFIIRLCPLDYHRFHFPAAGVAENSREITGDYYSVNPIALSKIAEIYCRNKRQLTIFNSEDFNDILLIEVGATCVGSIVQTYCPNDKLAKGEEKGYFKFGGSTVIMFLKPNTIRIDQDLLDNTLRGIETRVKMGTGIAIKDKMGVE